MATPSSSKTARPTLMFWEHQVCKTCLRKNCYAIWLIWYGCFEHHSSQEVNVVFDTDNMKLVRVRNPPNSQSTGIKLCRLPGSCHFGDKCKYAHSQLELDHWKATLKVLRSNLIKELQPLKRVKSAEVCKLCLKDNPRAVWLTWLTCTNSSHAEELVTVVLGSDGLVEVRDWDPNSQQSLTLCSQAGKSGTKKCTCDSAHSQEELDYWKWRKVTAKIREKLGASIDRFTYPHGGSPVSRDGVECAALSCDSYKRKYHKLIYLDNLEHARKMVADCDGPVTIDNKKSHSRGGSCEVHVKGMTSTNMNYAYQKPAPSRAHITVQHNGKRYSVSGDVMDKTENTLIVISNSGLRFPLPQDIHVHIHFEYNHWYFQRLHTIIDYAQPELIERLITASPAQCERYLTIPQFDSLPVDNEYQPIVLDKILRGGYSSPFLLLGPFGTGKTHLLMVAIAAIAHANGRVLVCTHHNRGADAISEKLTSELEMLGFYECVLRLSPKDPEPHQQQPFTTRSVSYVTPEDLLQYPVIVTTFVTSLKLRERKLESVLQFTHIIIDEGAQSREPEALGPLLMAGDNTSIIIAGDNKQVGPKVSVLCETARSNGLGESIIERLLKLYDKEMSKDELNISRYSLLTNYRCHPSILMLASSLFYDCSLQPRSESETHPLAPYPIVFQCSSLKESDYSVSSAVNEAEATALLKKAIEFIKDWSGAKIAFLAGSEAQLNCMRSQFAKLKFGQLPCSIQFSLTYTIQGSEYDAVFLSTHEPTGGDGKPLNTVRSICNEYVFNTVITRSRSLIFVVGNPFRLIKMSSHFSVNCWSELIQRCMTCQAFHFPPDQDKDQSRSVQLLSEIVHTNQMEGTSDNDACNKGYRKLFMSQKDERHAANLTKNPVDIIGTRYWHDSDDEDDEDQEIITGQLELLTHRKGKIISDDPDLSGTQVSCAEERRCLFNHQTVKINKATKQIIIDQETVKETNKKYFGFSFLCRVKADSMIQFYPFNKTVPILINMPRLTKKYINSAVVCYHPASIGDHPRACNFIPKECALNMVFVVTYLRWRKKFPHPLGIVTGVLPCGTSVHTGDLLLRVAHNIPRTDIENEADGIDSAPMPLPNCRQFNKVITIDPEGSKDHDDALSCAKRGQCYEFGVHITDVQKFVQKDSSLNKIARERGCSVYSSTAQCVSHMLPQNVVYQASILPNQPRDAFSVIAKAVIKEKKNEILVSKIVEVCVLKSRINSTCELTYKQAYQLLFNGDDSVSQNLRVLWAIACHLKKNRLQDELAALHLSVDEEDEIQNPETHILVEELMIWANRIIAARLLDYDQPVIFRSQPNFAESDLDSLVTEYGQHLTTSLDLQQHVQNRLRNYRAHTVQILHETVGAMEHALNEGRIREALRLVQFEHLHPQVAVAHALFNALRHRALYSVAKSGDHPDSYSHSSLNCSHYTHFTSPIRRFVDLVIQRMLVAALNNNPSPYQLDELKEISKKMAEKHREADRYEDDRKSLDMALLFQQCSREFIYFVKKVETGELRLTFHDVNMKAASRHIRGVHLKYLNAVSIPQRETSPGPEEDSVEQTEADATKECTWLAKFASAQGTLASFLSNSCLKPAKSSGPIKMSIFTGEEPFTIHTQWHQRTLHASIRSPTQTIPIQNWRKLQEYAKSPPADIERVKCLLPSRQAEPQSEFPAISSSPLWVYELRRPLQSCEVLRVQLTGSFNRSTQVISPTVQLLEVGPNLRVCIQHNSAPTECFTDTALSKPPRQGHTSIHEYFLFWERAFLAEAATSSLTDTELLILTDVKLVWPDLRRVTDSQGQVFYQLPPIPMGGDYDEPNGYCACMCLSKKFATSSYDFFSIHSGDLVCVRCYGNHRGNDVRGVLHMVVHHVQELTAGSEEGSVLKGINVYLKFVGERPNYISQQLQSSLETLNYEIQVIQLPLSLRRVYKNLCALRHSPHDSLSRIIATEINFVKSRHIADLKDTLGSDVAMVASCIWSVGNDDHQLRAIPLANRQDPPNTAQLKNSQDGGDKVKAVSSSQPKVANSIRPVSSGAVRNVSSNRPNIARPVSSGAVRTVSSIQSNIAQPVSGGAVRTVSSNQPNIARPVSGGAVRTVSSNRPNIARPVSSGAVRTVSSIQSNIAQPVSGGAVRTVSSTQPNIARPVSGDAVRTVSSTQPNIAQPVSSGATKSTSSSQPNATKSTNKATHMQKLNRYQVEAIQLACSDNRFVMIQGPPGTGKSVTGAHIAYALAMKLRQEVGKVCKERELNPCVMYCGPSQQSVNVVLDILTSSAEVQASGSGLKIMRVYSNAIESKDFSGPKFNPLLFREVKVDGQCEEKYRKYALHHIIRERNKDIKLLDNKFSQLKSESIVPCSYDREKYKKKVRETSVAVLRDDVDIVLCTCNEAGSYRITNSVTPVYCIIDECAMATEPECMVVISRAENVVLIGDDQQLQPVLHNVEAQNMGLGTSLFERYVRSHSMTPHMLQIQYRMHASLCEFPSEEFYKSLLETDPSVEHKYKRELDRLDGFWPQGRDLPMVFCDVVGEEEENHTGHRGSARVGLESKRNSREARKIVEIADALISRHGVRPEEIAVITPYSAQKEEVKKKLKEKGRGIEKVTVKTITDAQGSEFGIVLLSTVRSMPRDELPVNGKGERIEDRGWMREHLGFITNRHQICVGITRCKYGLAIVGNIPLLKYDKTWLKLVQHYENMNCVVPQEAFPV